MTDDARSNGNGSRLSLGDVVDLLRDDAAAAELRGQRGRDELEGRLMAAIRQVSGQLDRYIEVHAGDHRASRTPARRPTSASTTSSRRARSPRPARTAPWA
jgi:hypothetical protein